MKVIQLVKSTIFQSIHFWSSEKQSFKAYIITPFPPPYLQCFPLHNVVCIFWCICHTFTHSFILPLSFSHFLTIPDILIFLCIFRDFCMFVFSPNFPIKLPSLTPQSWNQFETWILFVFNCILSLFLTRRRVVRYLKYFCLFVTLNVEIKKCEWIRST